MVRMLRFDATNMEESILHVRILLLPDIFTLLCTPTCEIRRIWKKKTLHSSLRNFASNHIRGSTLTKKELLLCTSIRLMVSLEIPMCIHCILSKPCPLTDGQFTKHKISSRRC
jgi:hypothetical protein